MLANMESSAVATGLEKISFHSHAKECSNYNTIEFISHSSKVMLKILQQYVGEFSNRLQQYVNRELPDVQVGFRKGRRTRDQIANIHWIIEKARELQKNIYFCFIDCTTHLTVWITTNCGNFWKRWEYQTTLPTFWDISMQVKKQQLELDMEQQNGSKSGKKYVKVVPCHPAYLASMQSISCEIPGWKKHRWNQDCR